MIPFPSQEQTSFEVYLGFVHLVLVWFVLGVVLVGRLLLENRRLRSVLRDKDSR